MSQGIVSNPGVIAGSAMRKTVPGVTRIGQKDVDAPLGGAIHIWKLLTQ